MDGEHVGREPAEMLGDAFTRWLMKPEAPGLEELIQRPSWHADARCQGQAASQWVVGFDDSAYEAEKAVCAECRVWEPCLSYALANRAIKGCWGGTNDAEREEIRRRVA